jgi:hypothetical protein
MKTLDLNRMGMTSLSTDEVEEINGGSFWSKLKALHASILAVAQFAFAEPLNAFGRGLSSGLDKGLQR